MQQRQTAEARLVRQLTEAQGLEYETASGYLAAAEAAMSLASAEGVPLNLRVMALSEHGNALRVNGQLAGAIAALDEAIVSAAELEPGRERDSALGTAHLRMAIVYDVNDSISAGLEHLQVATAHFENIFDEAALAKAQLVRGALYLRIDDFEHSEVCFRRSLEYYRRSGERDRIGSTLSNLSVVLRLMGRYKEAVASGREAAGMATSLLLRTTSMGNVASALAADGRLEEARSIAEEVMALLQELGDPNYVIEYRRSLAWILQAQGELEAARDMLTEALQLAEEMGYHRDAVQCRGPLAEIHRDLGEFELAYQHLEIFHQETLADNRKKTANQMEVQKWRLELENARVQADRERERRRHLAESLAELNDMHEKLAAHAVQLEWSSHRDALTELANRRYFDERLAREAERSIDFDEGVSLLMIDLDDFKSINDRFGHITGDEVLRTSARLLEAGTRRSDLCARLGGEEFAVLLTSDVEPLELKHLSEQLRKAFEDHDWQSLADGLQVTISIGAACLTEVEHDPLKLLKLADRRLYAAKRAGRNQVVTSLPQNIQSR